MSEPTYTPLDTAKNEIRLLKISPVSRWRRNPRVRCFIETVSLDSNLTFDALSYTWGSAKKPKYIHLNGRRHPVTKNLDGALRTLRRTTIDFEYIWIDALCINQQDVKERNHQVQLMQQIYSRAQTVHIWLGESAPQTPAVFDALKKVTAGASLEALVSNSVIVQGLQDFAQCAWWSRLWVLQEAVLASKPLLHWGKSSILFWPVVDVMYGLLYGLQSDADQWSYADAVTGTTLMNSLTRVIRLKKIRECKAESPVELMSYVDAFKVSNERDRVYGLLGLLRTSIRLQPEYAADVEAVYEDFTAAMTETSRSLQLLSLTGSAVGRRRSLPSWVPDYGHLPLRWRQNGMESRVCRVSCVASPIVRRPRRGCIDVEACFVGRIMHCGTAFPVYNYAQPLSHEVEESMRATLKQWQGLFLNLELSEAGSKNDTSGFWRTVTRNALLGHAQDDYSGVYAESANTHISQGWLNHDHTSSRWSLHTSYRASIIRMLAAARGMVFFTTDGRHIGVSNKDALPGDIITMIAGATPPFVLRAGPERGQATYQVVGPCYCEDRVYGGRSLDDAHDESATCASEGHFEEITLV